MSAAPAPEESKESFIAALYAADEAALRRTTLRTQAFRWGLVAISLFLLAVPLVLTSVFLNMNTSGAGHVVGLAGIFSGFLGMGCVIASLAALVDVWRSR